MFPNMPHVGFLHIFSSNPFLQSPLSTPNQLTKPFITGTPLPLWTVASFAHSVTITGLSLSFFKHTCQAPTSGPLHLQFSIWDPFPLDDPMAPHPSGSSPSSSQYMNVTWMRPSHLTLQFLPCLPTSPALYLSLLASLFYFVLSTNYALIFLLNVIHRI